MENRNGLVVGGRLTQGTGKAEPGTAIQVLEGIPRCQRITVSGASDQGGFVEALRDDGVTPHVAQKVRYSAIDGRITRHESYRAVSGKESGSKRSSCG